MNDVAMTEKTLAEQVADLRDGDRVKIQYDLLTIEGPIIVDGTTVRFIKPGIFLRYGDGKIPGYLTEIVSVERPKRRVKRGDIIDSETDLGSLEIPVRTLVRDSADFLWEQVTIDQWWATLVSGTHSLVSLDVARGPLRVIDVPGEGDES